MSLPVTTYPNPYRSVSGSVAVENDDVLLLCDTSSVACTINLPAFTSDYWNVEYKLYVVDYSGAAGTNNITIVPPSGFTINGASSYVMNVNSMCCLVRIVSNNMFICSSTTGGFSLSSPLGTISCTPVAGGWQIDVTQYSTVVLTAVSPWTITASKPLSYTRNANKQIVMSGAAYLASGPPPSVGWSTVANIAVVNDRPAQEIYFVTQAILNGPNRTPYYLTTGGHDFLITYSARVLTTGEIQIYIDSNVITTTYVYILDFPPFKAAA